MSRGRSKRLGECLETGISPQVLRRGGWGVANRCQ